MSRVIKFRCWSESYKKYLEDMQYPNGHSMLWIFASDGTPYHIEVGFDGLESTPLHLKIGEVVLEQFTGLTDRNGTEIYEGDIVFIPEVQRKYVVFYQNGCFKLYHADPSLNTLVWGTIERVEELVWDTEVIGNVHSTPDLICT